jgi:hypothetical protein
MKKTIAISLLLVLTMLGCGGDEPFTDCALGELTGAWRIHYAETDGNCGSIQDATVMADTESGCTVESQQVSADKCRKDSTVTCPTVDGLGTTTQVSVFQQVAADRIEGTTTIQLVHSTLGNCRSTYDVTVARL